MERLGSDTRKDIIGISDDIIRRGYSFTKDATSNIYCPASSTEWKQFGTGYGTIKSLHLCQEASGNLADSTSNGLTWTANGSPTYSTAITGWSRKGVTLAQTSGQCFQLTDGTTSPHPASDSIAAISYMKVTASGGTRVARAFAAGNLCWSILSTGKILLSVQNQTATTGTYDYRDGNVHPFILRFNRCTRTVAVITDKEILTAVWNDITEGRHGYGSSASTPPASTLLYDVEWEGEDAERVGARTLVELGWTLAYGVTTDTGTSIGTHLTDTVDGTRPLFLQVPAASRYETAANQGPYPLVLILSYYGTQTGLQEQSDLGFGSPTNGATTNLKDRDSGYLILAPNGKLDHLNNRYWNSGTACCDTDASGIDDTSYLGSLIDQVLKGPYGASVDRTKIWIIGRSNGAFMAHKLACARADVVTGILTMHGGFAWTIPSCAPSQPVHVVQFASTADPTYIYNGSHSTFNAPYTGTFCGAQEAIEATNGWLAKNGVVGGTLQTAYDTIDFITGVAGSETSRAIYSNCPANGHIELWTNSWAGHIPTYTANAPYTYGIAWLNAHPRT